MPQEKYVNHVVVDGQTLVDLRDDTVSSQSLLVGETAHGCDGAPIAGSLSLSHIETDVGQQVTLGGEFEVLDMYGSSRRATTFNMLDRSTCVQGYFIQQNGKPREDLTSEYSELIPVVAGELYTVSGICRKSGNKRYHGYTALGEWVMQITYSANVPLNDSWQESFTIPNNVAYVRLSISIADEDVQLERGTKTNYREFGNFDMVVLSASGVQKALIPLDLQGYSLRMSDAASDILTVSKNGDVSLIKRGVTPYDVITLAPITLPTLEEGDMIYTLASNPPSLTLRYVVDGQQAGGITPVDSILLSSNGSYDVANYAVACVDVIQGVFPSGTLRIMANGTYDVTSYASVAVSISTSGTNSNLVEPSSGDTDEAMS